MYNVNMQKLSEKQLKLFRIIVVFGLFFMCIATINNFVDGIDHEPFTNSLLYPYTNFLIPATNITTIVLCVLYLFIPQQVWIVFLLFFIQTAHLMTTGFETVGIMLYVNCLAVAFCSGYAQKHFLLKTIFSISYITFFLLLLIPVKGLKGNWTGGLCDFAFYTGHFIFSLSCYIILYKTLSDKLSFLLGDYKIPQHNPSLDLPAPGSQLNLKELGLTDRQIACIRYTIETSYNYKQIAEALITSESTVKKDMQDLYKLFGVKNREMLRILLVQYTISLQ